MVQALEAQAHRQIEAICGSNVSLSQGVQRMIVDAYLRGRCDALEELGLEESDISGPDGAKAWTL